MLNLGKPITAPVLIPVIHSSTPKCINDPFMVDGECWKVTALAFNSPHGVVFVDDVTAVDVAKIGSALGTHKLFPKGASIVFAEVSDNNTLKARVWQYGFGEVEYSDEAAGAAAVAAMMTQKTRKDEINVQMLGNNADVNRDENGNIILTPAEKTSAEEDSVKIVYQMGKSYAS